MGYLESLLGKEIAPDDHVFIHYGWALYKRKIVDAVVEMTLERESVVTRTPCYQFLATRDSDFTSEYW